MEVAPAERRPPLDRRLELLDRAVRRCNEDQSDMDAALVADVQGIGSGSDLVPIGPGAARRADRELGLGQRPVEGCVAPYLTLAGRFRWGRRVISRPP